MITKLKIILFSAMVIFCLSMPAKAQSVQDKALIENYLKARPPPCCDNPEPYSEELAQKPYLAPYLADILKSSSPEAQRKKTSIIFILGQMGNSDAFESLVSMYERESPSGVRIRLMTSLGACLNETNIEKYLDIIINDPELLSWLEEKTGKACRLDKACWKDFLQGEELKNFKDLCRKLSEPIIG